MKMLDLFSGTRSMAKAFESQGWEVYTIELDQKHQGIDWYADIMKVTAQDIIARFGHPNVIWASPPCTSYSIAGISHHRKVIEGVMIPVSDFATASDELIKHVIKLINELAPMYWYIENPRGGLRKMDFMQGLPLYNVSYCKYGDTRMKPTDIWTNHPDPQFLPMCKNGATDHISAPRGSATGTQGLQLIDRSVIPPKLCLHIERISKNEIRS